MKKLGMIAAVFTFVAAAVGLVVALVYFLDRKFGWFACDDEAEETEYVGEDYYAEDLPLPDAEEAAPAEEAPAEDAQE